MKLKGETGIMRKKFTSLQKEIDDHKEEIKKYQLETTKLNTVIRNLEKDIAGLKKEIQERDETIQDKVIWELFIPFLMGYNYTGNLFFCVKVSQIIPCKSLHWVKKLLQGDYRSFQEKRIYDLKKKNQELEKFKFVLDYKIKELKKQIEPRENDIKQMKEQIQEVSIYLFQRFIHISYAQIMTLLLTKRSWTYSWMLF